MSVFKRKGSRILRVSDVACIGTAAWLASGGGTSVAGGVAAWILKRRKRRKISKDSPPATS
jgi:hypothetical protein